MVKKIFAKSYVALMLLFLYAPIIVLFIFSFTDSDSLGVWNGFTIKLYGNVFKNVQILTALKNTISVALVSAILSTILGTMGAIGIFYSKGKAKKAMNFLSQIPVMNAEIVMALSLTLLFTILGFKSSYFTLIVGHVVLTAPFVVLSVMPKLTQMDPNEYEAALDLGATPTQAMFKVMIPEITPGVLTGFLLSITLSLDDYIITAFLRNKNFNTLSTYVQGITAKGPLPSVLRALTTIIVIIIFVIILLLNAYMDRVKKRQGSKHGTN